MAINNKLHVWHDEVKDEAEECFKTLKNVHKCKIEECNEHCKDYQLCIESIKRYILNKE